MNIAIQGQHASYHDIATRRFFGDDARTVNCNLPFRNVFEQLSSGAVDYALVAVENSLYGSINEVYDLLLEYRPVIIGEVYLQISQCLIGFPGTKVSDITAVHSHPIALAQCEEYLDATLAHAERFEQNDTAGSVADIKEWGDLHRAAIASKSAAEYHGMEVLAESIESNRENYTRFVVLSKKAKSVEDANKTSLVLHTPADTKPGALYRALGGFAERGINLLMLQSRPIAGKAWKYLFYLDVAASTEDTAFKDAIQDLKQQGCTITLLGSYVDAQSRAQKA